MEKKKLDEIIVIIGVLLILTILLHILFMLNIKLQLMNNKMNVVDKHINQILSDISNRTIDLDNKFSQIEKELGFLNLQIVYGKIRTNGTIEYGTNFSAFKAGVGSYGVAFGTAFGEKPTVLVSIDDPSQPSGLIRVIPDNAGDKVDIQIFSDFNATTLADRGFNFVAIGKKK